MSFRARREYFFSIVERYRKGNRKEKTKILDEFCAVTGLHRKYAITQLNRGVRLRQRRPGPKVIYDQRFLEVLFDLWLKMRRMCSKKMVAAIPVWLRFYGHSKLSDEVRRKLMEISAPTIDRLLKPMKKKRGLSTTKPGEFLKNKIPLQIYHRALNRPGYLQVDTVAHCGTSVSGIYANTLTTTDLYSQWTDTRAVWGKQSRDVMDEFLKIEKKLPFIILGYASDNGGEVLNERIYRYLDLKGVFLSRARPYRKNDNAHVEQRNNSHVRRLLGYERFEHPELVKLMNEIYVEYWNPIQNFFTPSMKQIEKHREGGKIIKRYDEPKTPYQRLMDCPMVPQSMKMNLKDQYESLNPIELTTQLEQKLKTFFRLVYLKRGVIF